VTDTVPSTDPRPAPEGVGSALRRGWRALAERTLVARKGGRDRMRLPLSVAAILALILLSWSWPIVLAAVGIALIARVEFVIVREHVAA
jgi:hypothetical protein